MDNPRKPKVGKLFKHREKQFPIFDRAQSLVSCIPSAVQKDCSLTKIDAVLEI